MADVTQAIANAAAAAGVNPALAIEVATAESGLNPNTPDSSAGAIGLFQLMPATAAQLGVNPRDVNQNIQGGVTYLAQMLAQFQDTAAALGAYNWGPGHVAQAIALYGSNWLAYAPAETQNYVTKILNNLGTQYQLAPAPDPSSSDPSTDDSSDSSSSFGSTLLYGLIGILALWAYEEFAG